MTKSITEKNYKKIALQVSLNGLSFCIFDTLNHKILHVEEISFTIPKVGISAEDLFEDAFKKHSELTAPYDEIIVIHANNLSTFVPSPLFDEEYLGSYLQYNTKVFETDFFAFDTLEPYGIHHVYIPYVNINNFFIDQFGSFDYKHANTILVSKLLDVSKNNDEKKMYVHFNLGHFEIIVIQNQQLLLFNSFEYKTPEDFVYYILFTAEQLNLNPEKVTLELIGSIEENDSFYTIVYKYIRNVCFFNVKGGLSNPYSESENRKYFTLFNS